MTTEQPNSHRPGEPETSAEPQSSKRNARIANRIALGVAGAAVLAVAGLYFSDFGQYHLALLRIDSADVSDDPSVIAAEQRLASHQASLESMREQGRRTDGTPYSLALRNQYDARAAAGAHMYVDALTVRDRAAMKTLSLRQLRLVAERSEEYGELAKAELAERERE